MRQVWGVAAVLVAGVAFATEMSGRLDLRPEWSPDAGAEPTWAAGAGSCTLSGRLKSDSAYPGTTIAFLPAACKPHHSFQFTASGGTSSMKVDIANTGEMVMATGSAADFVSFDGVSFPLE